MFGYMSRQNVRRARLIRALQHLSASGIDTFEAQARHLGNAIGAARLEAMVTGSYINTWFARCVEHSMGLTKGWMDEADAPDTDVEPVDTTSV
ncbi:hypothetical protein SAMN02800694_0774 [Luteibacter sp. UNCMF331Sha3.1]|nr:hypothetical protein SAMN02800694_0774 [Luteibacter sp. UNCMF331Sha3.1]